MTWYHDEITYITSCSLGMLCLISKKNILYKSNLTNYVWDKSF